MTFAELLTILEDRAALPAGRLKDCKTSLRYLADALGSDAVDDACQKEATWAQALETHFAALTAAGRVLSAATRRNTRNNLRLVFRLAGTLGVLTVKLAPVLPTPRRRTDFKTEKRRTAPYQTSYRPQTGPRRYGLPFAKWPPCVQAGWQAYLAAVDLRLRASTLKTYVQLLEVYLGYFVTICGREPTWDELFDPAALKAFVLWHAARTQRRVSAHGQHVARTIAAMAVVLEHPARQALAKMVYGLPEAEPLHVKRHHMVTRAQLEAVAEACLAEGRLPVTRRGDSQFPGAMRALRFQQGVMLKILGRIPLRQRNLREIRLEDNLFTDARGDCQLYFRGSELKIGTRHGGLNEYKVNLTQHFPSLLPVLKEWLEVYRPRLKGAAASPLLFLTSRGTPYTDCTLHEELQAAVAIRTGKLFYPHLIRTIWATEFLEKTQDYATAATMLGDTLAVVMKTYYDIVPEDHHAKASAFSGEALHTG